MRKINIYFFYVGVTFLFFFLCAGNIHYNKVLQKNIQSDKDIRSNIAYAAAIEPQIKTRDIYQKMENGHDSTHTLVIGDNIGASNPSESWVNLISKWLDDKYKVINFTHNISVGEESVLGGIVNYNSDQKFYSNEEYDIVFICLGQNDQDLLSIDKFSNMYEALIRNIKTRSGSPDIFLLIENGVKDNKYSDEIIKLADYYGLNVIDTRILFAKSGLSEQKLIIDGAHLSTIGHQLYSKAIMDTIEKNLQNGRHIKYDSQLLTPLHSESIKYMDIKYYTNNVVLSE